MQLHRVDRIARISIEATLLAGALLVAADYAQAQVPAVTPSQDAAPASGLFLYLDADRDGFVTRQEAGRISGFTQAFAEADDNRDSRLSRDEFIKARAIHDRTRGSGVFEDGLITVKVKTALVREVDLKSLRIAVETYDGQVILSGMVDSGRQLRQASEVAAAVEGVTSVKNALAVKRARS